MALALLALALWLTSLALVGLVLYAKQRQILGTEILIMGWLSPLIGNFAWFANPLFLWALLRLWAKNSAVGPALLSILFSLDVLRFSTYLLDEGGGSTPVYGYGWGMVLWFAALFMLLAAVGTRQIEKRLDTLSAEGTDEWLRPIGIMACVAVLMGAGYLAITDRKHANAAERERLSGLAFKRGPVCGAGEPFVSQPLRPGTGPLEVVLSEGSYTGSSSPFNKPSNMLKWGIPVLRLGDRDYSYSMVGDEQLLVSVPAKGSATASLDVTVSGEEGRRPIAAKLVEISTGRIVFDQVWQPERGNARYCPEYSSYPKSTEQPRRLLIEALGLTPAPETPAKKASPPAKAAYNQVIGVVLNGFDEPGDAKSVDRNPSNFGAKQGNAATGRRPWAGNRNCPDDVGWDGWGSEGSPSRLDTGWPFMVGDKAYYPGQRGQYKALCAGGDAYLFVWAGRDGKYFLNLEKRRLSDFHRQWGGVVVIDDKRFVGGEHTISIDSLTEGVDGLTIGLVDEKSGKKAVVRAPQSVSRETK
ncbi:MAG: hypothetical protein IPK34_01110 [Ramlibacter sp.]|nr:hypothetical protein [Ramlibacter sp.]